MAFVPADTQYLAPGIAANHASAWTLLCTNGDEVYEAYTPTVIDQYRALTETNTSFQNRLYWKVFGNEDLLTWRVRFLYQCALASPACEVYADVGATDSATATGLTATSWTWETMDITATVSDAANVRFQMKAGAANTLYVAHVQMYLVGTAPAAGTLASGYVRTGSGASTVYAANSPISTERVARALANPTCIAIDRPYVVAHHIGDVTTAYGTKSAGLWGNQNTTSFERVGRLLALPSGRGLRPFRMDLYFDQSGAGAAIEIVAGTYRWEVSTAGWNSVVFETASDQPMDIQALVKTGAANSAAIRSFMLTRWPVGP